MEDEPFTLNYSKKLLSGLLNMMMDIKLSAHFQKDGESSLGQSQWGVRGGGGGRGERDGGGGGGGGGVAWRLVGFPRLLTSWPSLPISFSQKKTCIICNFFTPLTRVFE
jgi:hypothetical protein